MFSPNETALGQPGALGLGLLADQIQSGGTKIGSAPSVAARASASTTGHDMSGAAASVPFASASHQQAFFLILGHLGMESSQLYIVFIYQLPSYTQSILSEVYHKTRPCRIATCT